MTEPPPDEREREGDAATGDEAKTGVDAFSSVAGGSYALAFGLRAGTDRSDTGSSRGLYSSGPGAFPPKAEILIEASLASGESGCSMTAWRRNPTAAAVLPADTRLTAILIKVAA